MKRILLSFVFATQFACSSFAQIGPVKGKGQAQGTFQTIERLSTPNSGVTVTGDKSVLLEGDRDNLLVNPGFEHQTFSTGWTVNAGTATVDTTNFYDGLKSASISLTAVTGDILTQCVTPTGQKTGINLEHSLRVKTTLTNLQVCSVHGSTEVQCVGVPGVDSWVQVPATSVAPASGAICVKLKSTSSATGTVKIDEGYLGLNNKLGTFAQAKNVVNFVWSGALTATHDTDILFTWSGATQNKLENFTHASGVFTATVAGDYQVKFCPRLDHSSGSASVMRAMIAKVYKNSTSTPLDASGYIHGLAQNNINGGGEPSSGFYANPPPCVVNTTSYNAGDAIRFKAYQANGSGLSTYSWVGGTLEINYFPTSSQQVLTVAQQKTPTITRITSGSGTYTVPPGATTLRVKMTGGGGGANGNSGTSCTSGSNGASTTFGNATAIQGLAGATQGACQGQSLSSNTNTITGAITIIDSISVCGQGGSSANASAQASGGNGGSNFLAIGGAGSAREILGSAGRFGGGGGGTGSFANSTFMGCGGGNSGGYLEFLIPNPSGTFAYTIGTGGAGGTGARANGAAGGDGIIIVEEYYGYNAPIVIGSVTSNSTNAERIERANVVNNGTTCATTSPNNAISCSFTATGRCTCTFSPAFSAGVVTCTPVANFSSGVNQISCTNAGTPSTTTVIVDCKNNLSDANFDFGIICYGPK